MKKYCKTLLPVILFCTLACTREVPVKPTIILTGTSMLQEIYENKKLKVKFDYNMNRIATHVLIDSPTTRTFNYHYDFTTNLPDTIQVTESIIQRTIIVKETYDTRTQYFKILPVFKDGRLSEFSYYRDAFNKLRYVLDYDANGKVVSLSEFFPSGKLSGSVNYIWEGENIKQYELNYNSGGLSYTIISEFEYDDRINPFALVYREIGFDFVNFLPLNKNNCTRWVQYQPEMPDIKNETNYEFTYSGIGYPFVRMTYGEDFDGNKSTTYSVFKYE